MSRNQTVSCQLNCPPSHYVLAPPAGFSPFPAEERFLSAVLHYTNSSTVHFKLSPAYVLYAVGRSALQRKPFSPATAQTHSVTQIINKTVAMTERVIQASPNLKAN